MSELTIGVKVSFNDGIPELYRITDSSALDNLIRELGDVDYDSVVSFAVLSRFYFSQTYLTSIIGWGSLAVVPDNLPRVILGTIVNYKNLVEHSDSHSIVGFNDYFLREFLLLIYGQGGTQAEIDSIRNSTNEELKNLVIPLGLDMNIGISRLRIHKMTQEELRSLGNDTIFHDAYESIKNRVPVVEDSLEVIGLVRPTLNTVEGYVEFTSEMVLVPPNFYSKLQEAQFGSYYGSYAHDGSPDEVSVYVASFRINEGAVITRWFYSSVSTVTESIGMQTARLIPEVFRVEGDSQSTSGSFFIKASTQAKSTPPEWEGDWNTDDIFSVVNSSDNFLNFYTSEEVNTFRFVRMTDEISTRIYPEIDEVMSSLGITDYSFQDVIQNFQYAENLTIPFEAQYKAYQNILN